MTKKIPVVAIVGPTASGKTSLSVALAKKYDGEIVSGDSMQIYKGMDIGTAKPTEEEKQGIPHHLFDIVEPSESYSVARYCRDAKTAVEDITRRNKLPIICGGTGLYIDSFISNVPFFEQEDVHPLREALMKEYEADKGESLYMELEKGDPVAAAKIHKNNAVKLIRAVEILRSGRTLTQQAQLTKQTESPYQPLYIGLNFSDRELLYQRIERRVDMMIKAGLLEEAERLYNTNLSATARAAIGYKELFAYFDGNCTLEEAANAIKINTRHYAKRQLTWFRRNKNAVFIEASQPFEKILEEVQKHMEIFTNM